MIEMIAGATRELVLGDPRDPATHVGPVIDDAPSCVSTAGSPIRPGRGGVMFRWDDGRALPPHGRFVPPTMIGLDRASDLQEEVVRPGAAHRALAGSELDALLDDVVETAQGSRSASTPASTPWRRRSSRGFQTANVYVNRSMIGAVVGTQPFGGTGSPGTGPKAGGPNYLRRFATEQTVTINTGGGGWQPDIAQRRRITVFEYEHPLRYITKTSSAAASVFRNASPFVLLTPRASVRGPLTNERVRPCVSLVIAPLQLRRRRIALSSLAITPATAGPYGHYYRGGGNAPCSVRWPACSAPSLLLAARRHHERQYGLWLTGDPSYAPPPPYGALWPRLVLSY